ncbi:AraC-like DNA-binding protein [Dongia mobilis]|uniref:AraC-like DNA-binding protein n=1 Tax=Dongia mobilis TaxID=578943 RepID=A0A4R6WMG3_9PROT|nr:AraC family transcriptional regulator [Dongia mobilis]TDQ82053.1 AraC-like DNA-binding protein [Dongia mobilis]
MTSALMDLSASARGGDAAPVVLAAAATGLVDFIGAQGGDVDSIFGNSGIAPDMAGAPTLKVKLASYCRLFEEAARQIGGDRREAGNFGLWFGQQFQPRDLGMWGYAAISAPNLGVALDNLVRLFHYHQESSGMRMVRGHDGMMRLEYQIYASEIVERRQDAELSLGMFANVIRECCGPRWAPLEVHFEHPRPALWKEHEAAFDAPVYFSQPTNALVFRPELLERGMPGSDLQLMTMMRTCLESLGSHRSGDEGLVERVKTAIRVSLPNGYPALERIAQDLRLSPGSIQRELAAAGLTYKDAVETTRQSLARMYLDQHQLPLTEIALLLGYSELSAFTRAFTRWTGVSPRAYRKQAH